MTAIDDFTSFMHSLADEADAIARRYFRQGLAHELKSDNSPVTIADKEIEAVLVARIRAAYPEYGIFGEETARINPDAALQWVIDPIDGTRAFIEGRDTFVTLIALCEWHPPFNLPPQGGEDEHRESEGGDWWPVLALISQPIRKQRWIGNANVIARSERDAAIHRAADGLPRRPDGLLAMTDATLATTSLDYFTDDELQRFRSLEAQCARTLLNLDGYAAGMMADGEVDIIIEAGLKPYDFCALVPVIEQAGGIVTDWERNPLTLYSDGHLLAAANKTLHKKALNIISSSSSGQMSADV